MKVKICGVTSARDARTCCQLGADAIGLNFFSGSLRFVSIQQARVIANAVTPLVSVVGVFVDSSLRFMQQAIREVGLSAVQLHGAAPPEVVNQLSCPVIRVAHVKGKHTPRLPRAGLLLLDTAQVGHGGGGLTFDWSVAAKAARRRPIMLAGGLTPDNVAKAIQAVRPYGVDVASGVERAPGKKDPVRVAAFVEAARRHQ
jgi:phosphoribosylanthranilate isomerase